MDKIASRLEEGSLKIIVAKRLNVVTGFSLSYVFASPRFAFLDYIAVKEEYRNQGIGSRLYNATCELLEKNYADGGPLFLEVEDPAYGTVSEQRTRAERVSFYKHLGVRAIADFKYVMPFIAGIEPPQMLLMVHTGGVISSLNSSFLRSVLIAIYERVYSRKLGDPYLSSMLENLTGFQRIRLSESGTGK